MTQASRARNYRKMDQLTRGEFRDQWAEAADRFAEANSGRQDTYCAYVDFWGKVRTDYLDHPYKHLDPISQEAVRVHESVAR